MMNGFGEHGWGFGMGMGFGRIIALIVLVAIIWLIVKLVNQNSNSNLPDSKSPQDILKARYASGEISKEEYEEKKWNIL